jgi:hypothetical protein
VKCGRPHHLRPALDCPKDLDHLLLSDVIAGIRWLMVDFWDPSPNWAIIAIAWTISLFIILLARTR